MIKNNEIIAAIDIGSSKIASVTGFLDQNSNEISLIASSISKSEGFSSECIKDMEKAQNTMLSSICEIENISKRSIKSVNVSIPGTSAQSCYISQKVHIELDQVTSKDVANLTTKLINIFNTKHDDQEIIHYFPIEYSIDDRDKITNPIGINGKVLGCTMYIISIPKNVLNDMIMCFSKCHIRIDNIALGIYTSGLACLTQDDMEMGSLILEFGSKTTSFGIFFDGKLVFCDHINIGSFHISSDIAKAFSIDFEIAERIKIFYGSAVQSTSYQSDFLDSSLIGSGEDISHIRKEDLDEVVFARVEEIFEEIKNKYDRTDLDHLISRKIILTGCGTNLSHLADYVQKLFKKNTKIGTPLQLKNPDLYKDLTSSIACVGTIRYVSEIKENKEKMTNNNSRLAKIIEWIKDNI